MYPEGGEKEGEEEDFAERMRRHVARKEVRGGRGEKDEWVGCYCKDRRQIFVLVATDIYMTTLQSYISKIYI